MLAKEISQKDKERRINSLETKKSLEVLEDTMNKDIPAGYIRMELSTEGLLDAPKVFHVRPFDTKEIVALSITAESELPLKLGSIIDDMIYEDISINDFHENEVIELIVKLFAIFYDRKIELTFPWNAEDEQYLKENGQDARVQDLKNKTWVPKSVVDLGALDFYKVDPSKLKKHVELTSKKSGFKVRFTYPKFGDVVVIKKFLDGAFRDKEASLKTIIKKLEVRKRIFDDAAAEHKEVDANQIPYLSKEETDRYTEYETGRALFAIDLVRALHLEGFEDKDLSDTPLSEKIQYIKDPRINHSITQKIEKEFKAMEFGINPELDVVNPITGNLCKRRFLFRILDILQAITEFDSDEYAVGYE